MLLIMEVDRMEHRPSRHTDLKGEVVTSFREYKTSRLEH